MVPKLTTLCEKAVLKLPKKHKLDHKLFRLTNGDEFADQIHKETRRPKQLCIPKEPIRPKRSTLKPRRDAYNLYGRGLRAEPISRSGRGTTYGKLQ